MSGALSGSSAEVAKSLRPVLKLAPILPAYRQVAEQLRLLVLNGELTPGARLPSEGDLCGMFSVSRSTVREALRVLSSQGLVETTRGVAGGTFVVRPRPEQISEYLGVTLGMVTGSTISVETVLETRTLLESPAARLAAERRSKHDLEDLLRSANMDLGTGPNDQIFRDNWAFHRIVFRASGNSLLSILSRPVSEVIRTRFAREKAPAAFWRRVRDEHRRICAGIAESDGAVAESEMRSHLEHLAATYRRIERR